MSPQKLRHPHTFEDGITQAMGRLTAKGAAAAIDRSESLVRKASDPDSDATLSLQQGLLIDAAWRRDGGEGRGPILEAYIAQLEALAEPAPHRIGEPLVRIRKAGTEYQEAVNAFIDLQRVGGGVAAHARVEQEIAEAIGALQAMLADVQALAERQP